MAIVKIADVVVPSIFTPYVQQLTTAKSRIVQSGALVLDSALDNLIAGGGLTFNVPSWKDLDGTDADNVGSDDETTLATPSKTGTSKEIAVRMSRNKSWSDMDLATALAGSDPGQSIASRVGYYRTQRLQAAFLATVKGVFADNAAAPSGSEHVQNDMTVDISGVSFTDGVTNFSAEAVIDATLTMGDSMEDLTLIVMHSVVYGRAQKNNLIDFIPDSEGRVRIPTFLGRLVVVDDGMPVSSGVYETWFFGNGALRLGVGNPKVPTETIRVPAAGNGAGQETLHNRWEWCIHPVGNAYVGTAANGGPSNAATSNNLAAAGSWQRVYPERKQIKIARLITREA